MVDTVTLAFDKADQYRMPAMILADGLLGQMMEPVTFPEPRTTLPDKSDWAACGHKNQREHHIINSLYLDAPLLEAKVKERFKRYAIIEETETDASCIAVRMQRSWLPHTAHRHVCPSPQ